MFSARRIFIRSLASLCFVFVAPRQCALECVVQAKKKIIFTKQKFDRLYYKYVFASLLYTMVIILSFFQPALSSCYNILNGNTVLDFHNVSIKLNYAFIKK